MQSSSQRRRRKSSSNPIADVEGTKPALQRRPSTLYSFVTNYGLRAVALFYGSVVFTLFALRAVWDGVIQEKDKEGFYRLLEKERERAWDVSKPHPSGLRHAFFQLAHGINLHYLTNAENIEHDRTKDLVIFLHGFPDSAVLWTKVISQLCDIESCTMVAPDLPGFGGSDNLDKYGANEIMEAMLDFCIGMRQKYLSDAYHDKGKVIVVAFDWGGVVGFRLASDAPEVADRFILANTAHPPAATRNVKERWQTSKSLYATWRRSPLNYGLLFKAFQPLRPVLKQFERSGYIFVFNLPWLMARQTVTRCNLWFVRFLHSLGIGYKTIVNSDEVIEGLAGFMGPQSASRVTEVLDDQYFGMTVCKRSQSSAPFVDTLRYYRDGLATQPWDKPLDTILRLADLADHNTGIRKRRSSVASSQLEGALGAPATVVFGTKDPALDTRIMLEGLDEYMTRNSQIVRLPVGHWVPTDGEGPVVLAAVVRWALEDESKEGLDQAISSVSKTARVTMSK